MLDAPASPEEQRRLRAYDRLNAIADVLAISVVMVFAYFFPTPLFHPFVVYGLGVFMAILSILWHVLVPERLLVPAKLFAKSIIDALFVTLVVHFTGATRSPFLFLYYVILPAVALSLGLRPTFVVAGVITVGYVLASGVAIEGLLLEPLAFVYFWATVVSFWLVGFLAAFLADEAEKARRAVAEAKEKVEIFSKIDWLTGLYNMRHFDAVAVQEFARAERYGRPLALLMVDSDHLKRINDTYGHQAGDQLIADLSRLIMQQARMSDTVIRYGGDEFLVVLPETDAAGARFLAERIRSAVETYRFSVNGREVANTVSIGIASYPTDAADTMSLLARADAALYQSKLAGRNQVTAYTEGMDSAPLPVVEEEPIRSLAADDLDA
ncbi:MAG: diguanylate cyclase [Chloroflexi bacterium]|nr:diguanylate cyclase [Chloroflexota bacterium]